MMIYSRLAFRLASFPNLVFVFCFSLLMAQRVVLMVYPTCGRSSRTCMSYCFAPEHVHAGHRKTVLWLGFTMHRRIARHVLNVCTHAMSRDEPGEPRFGKGGQVWCVYWPDLTVVSADRVFGRSRRPTQKKFTASDVSSYVFT